MKKIGMLALFLVLSFQLLFFGVQTFLAIDFHAIKLWDLQKQDNIRKPSSIDELPSKGPIQELKFQVLPDDFPINENFLYKTPVRLGDSFGN